MKRIRYITRLAAVLIAALAIVACDYQALDQDKPELVVSLYIPDAVMTKSETGLVDPLDNEKTITSLQVWVFLHEAVGSHAAGSLISYRSFGNSLDETGLAHSTITRFGMPLSEDMFRLLTTETGDPLHKPTVDVYALANAASAIGISAKEQLEEASSVNRTITSADLDDYVITGNYYGTSELTTSVGNGLPMSGVMKGVTPTGGYPVLNISTLTLTRAVSKIRFVFCQQANPPTGGSNVPTPFNSNCVIKSIRFDGGSKCQIADKEYIFTTDTYPNTSNLFSIDGYASLATEINGEGSNPLISNSSLHLAEYPENYAFQTPGHESESAQQYESRLSEIPAASQFGPIYLRETDKDISGTITYNAGGEDKTATFSLCGDKLPEERDILSRNHSWIVYAYFAEETKTLQLSVVVLPWDYTSIPIEYKQDAINVVRRFTVTETVPATFFKEETTDGFFNIHFWYKVKDENDQWVENVIKGDIIIATPVGQLLEAFPVVGVNNNETPMTPIVSEGVYQPIFIVDPMSTRIYRNYTHDGENPDEGKIECCKIDFTIRCNPFYGINGLGNYDTALNGQCIDLHFWVKIGDGANARYIDISSESLDLYRFTLDPNWATLLNP